jgi:hypothetical protein
MSSILAEVRRALARLRADEPSRAVQWVLLGLVLCGGLLLRAVNLDAPALDRTAWKEIDYLEVSRSYWEGGFRFAFPEVRWPAEPPRVTAMELPLVPFGAAILYQLFGFGAGTARALPLLAYLATSLYVFLLARREAGAWSGLAAAASAMLLPLFHPFGNLLFSDPMVLPCAVATLFHLVRWLADGRPADLACSALAFGIAVAIKLEPLYLVLPAGWLLLTRAPIPGRRATALAAFAFALLPAVLWYGWAYTLAMSSLDVFGIFGGLSGHGHDKFQTLTMVGDPHWWKTMTLRILKQLVGGKLGLLMLGVGSFAAWGWRASRLFGVYLLAIVIYVLVVAEGHLDAPYRQLSALPVLAFLVGQGALGLSAAGLVLARRLRLDLPAALGGLAALGLVAALLLQERVLLTGRDPTVPAWPSRWEASRIVLEHAGPGARLVTLGEYTMHKGGNDLSPVLYHYARARGWSLQAPDWSLERIEALRARGATHLAAIEVGREPAMRPFLDALEQRYPALHSDAFFVLLDLRAGGGRR